MISKHITSGGIQKGEPKEKQQQANSTKDFLLISFFKHSDSFSIHASNSVTRRWF